MLALKRKNENNMTKNDHFDALGITFLLMIPFTLIINIILSKMTAEPVFDVWDMLFVFILLILAFSSFICDCAKKKGMLK